MVKVGSNKMEQRGGINKGLKLKYIKRKASIKKKTMELAILCGINACMVCFGPDGEVETWPEDQSTVKAIIEMYKDQTGKKKPVQPMDMDSMMTMMVQPMDMAMDTGSMMMMMEKKNNEDEDLGKGKSDDLLCGLSLESLKSFSGMVGMKLEAINARIELAKLQELVSTKQSINNNTDLKDQIAAKSDHDHLAYINYALPIWGGDHVGFPTSEIMSSYLHDDEDNFLTSFFHSDPAQPMAMDMMVTMMEKNNKEDEKLSKGLSVDLPSGLSVDSLESFSGMVEMKLEANIGTTEWSKVQELVSTEQSIISTYEKIAPSDHDRLPCNYAMTVWGLPTNEISTTMKNS